MKKIISILLITLLLFSFIGCGRKETSSEDESFVISLASKAIQDKYADKKLDYSLDEYWYQTGQEYDENKIDVFYCLSTTLLSSKDENGNPSLFSTLTKEDREIMDTEYEYMSTEIFDSEHFNFIAPYYRQMTFETYEQSKKKDVLPAATIAAADICTAFNYYMDNVNHDKPFIIAGFSQGGIMTQILLINMTDEEYSRLIAAYSIGFEVTEGMLEKPHFKAATGEDDLGVIISYNSVSSPDNIWAEIEGNSAACINPLNWKTDDTPATLKYDGDEAKVHIDKDMQILIVEGLDSEKYDGMGYPLEKGIYHMWDPRFYSQQIHENAIHRAELFNEQKSLNK